MNTPKLLVLAVGVLFVATECVLAGPGGYIYITNRTPNVLVRGHHHSYQMPHWDNEFPRVVYPNSQQRVYVEFAHTSSHKWEDDAAEMDYQIEGTNQRLTFHSWHRAGPKNKDPNLYVTMDTRKVDLGWHHNGNHFFYIGGSDGNFEIREGQ